MSLLHNPINPNIYPSSLSQAGGEMQSQYRVTTNQQEKTNKKLAIHK